MKEKNRKQNSRFNKARTVLIIWCLFIGIGAVSGSVGMLTAIDGSNLEMQEMLPYFQVLPFADILFQNFLFSGIALLCVNGITNLTAAILLLKKRKSGVICGTVFGGTLMLWICIQFVIFPMNFLSTIYFIFGLTQLITGICALIFYKQEQFQSQQFSYSNIGADKSKLVVYFSRMGYTKKAAYEEADRTGAMIYEIKSTEVTEGTLGFWWCGRFGMHRWDMPIKPVEINLEQFSCITICSPIWVFHLSAPVRSFCKAANGKIKKAKYIFVHFQKNKYPKEFDEMDSLLGITADEAISICSRQGRIIYSDKIR